MTTGLNCTKHFLGMAAAVMLTAGCNDSPSAPSADPAARSASVQASGPGGRTLDNDFEDLNRQVSGFGGFYFDTDGTPTIALTDTTVSHAARRAVMSYLGGKGRSVRGGENGFRIRKANYDFNQLSGAMRSITQSVARHGITQTDIDEAGNRIVIGAIDEAARVGISQRITSLGVPAGMVTVELIAPTVSTAALGDVVRPTVGGLKIRVPVPTPTQGSFCTLGYNVRTRGQFTGVYGSTPYFVTASHYTSSMGTVTGDTVGQPDAAHPIGIEVADPAYFNNTVDAQCPVSRLCRYSDAALIQYIGSVSNNWGTLAKAGSWTGSSYNIIGSYAIAGETSILFSGDTLSKVGERTGQTKGPLTSNTCVTVTQYKTVNGVLVDTGKDFICQFQASLPFNTGDSGSPVFKPYGTSAYLVGILWGSGYSVYGDSSSPVRTTFSLYHHVASELGNAIGGAGTTLLSYNAP